MHVITRVVGNMGRHDGVLSVRLCADREKAIDRFVAMCQEDGIEQPRRLVYASFTVGRLLVERSQYVQLGIQFDVEVE